MLTALKITNKKKSNISEKAINFPFKVNIIFPRGKTVINNIAFSNKQKKI